jgi:bacteriocin-like protein
MKELNFEQMAQVEGGGAGCREIGAGLMGAGVVTGNALACIVGAAMFFGC